MICLSGSPPRGRGKEAVAPFPLPAAGITPAWAGKRTSPHLYCELSKDHPRVGGEKQNTEQNLTKVRGSPPRGRGKVGPCGVGGTQKRITPAWAGKRPCQERPVEGRWDHPRVGGEKRRLSECAQWAEGSPPRGRGKGITARPKGLSGRITPAWAGKRAAGSLKITPERDHPRVGGEKLHRYRSSTSRTGSPPRGRGKGS